MFSFTDTAGALALPVFGFYMLIACNFLKELFGCRLQTLLDKSMYAKHVLAFVLLYFLIILAVPENADQNALHNLGVAAVVYIWFVITTHTSFWVMLVVLLLLLGAYLASAAKKRHDTHKDKKAAKSAETWQNVLAATAMLLSVMGFFHYVSAKRAEYGKRFTWTRFLAGGTQCATKTPVNVLSPPPTL